MVPLSHTPDCAVFFQSACGCSGTVDSGKVASEDKDLLHSGLHELFESVDEDDLARVFFVRRTETEPIDAQLVSSSVFLVDVRIRRAVTEIVAGTELPIFAEPACGSDLIPNQIQFSSLVLIHEVRPRGIEPLSPTSHAGVLPLNQGRM